MKKSLLNVAAYIIMVTLNALSITVPLGGLTTEQLADKFGNPFTPVGFTFAIWSVIYTLLLFFVSVGLFNNLRGKSLNNKLAEKNIGVLFWISCFLNGGWILAWQYQFVGLSVFIMLGLLVTLIQIYRRMRINTPRKTLADRWVTFPAFSIYLGWISVATIANIFAWTVSIGWDGWGISQIDWTNIMVAVAALLGSFMLLKNRDTLYALVIIWALYGIMYKRTLVDPAAFASIILTTQICMAFLVGILTTTMLKSNKIGRN